ncbi:MAG: hypothetical protein IT347_02550 [Candidatus Eisenbacteria bacterium]|nr:hypothetical protein [Candidatus Eisenbacteria bacterium]
MCAFSIALLTPRAGEAAPSAPRVVWVAQERVYLAAPDSGAIVPGMLVRILDRHRELAVGRIEQVLDGTLASVRLEHGRIEADERLARLEVRLEPAPLLPVATLRVGLPASVRRALVPPCASPGIEPATLPRDYRSEPLPGGGLRLVAADSLAPTTRWPDTLIVRTFGDRTDEEIALERGDLDMAVFWPGEPSARLRELTSGFELLRGQLARGRIVARTRPGTSAPPHARVAADLARLNEMVFGFDLELLPRGDDGSGPRDTSISHTAGEGGTAAPGYEVDRRLPGWAALEAFLNRGRPAAGAVRVSIGWEDLSPARTDALVAGDPGLRLERVLAIRCPVLCARARAADVQALGADAFANLLQCAPGTERR